MLVTALLNLAALLIRSALSGDFFFLHRPRQMLRGPSAPRWSRGQNTPSGSCCWGEARSQTEPAEIDVWLTAHGMSEDKLQRRLKIHADWDVLKDHWAQVWNRWLKYLKTWSKSSKFEKCFIKTTNLILLEVQLLKIDITATTLSIKNNVFILHKSFFSVIL